MFSTFRTGGRGPTGEAVRQRAIIGVLASQPNPAERTRTAISRRIAGGSGSRWKNIYSGIFRDVEEVLLPLGLAREEGRLPLKRGPRALQERGIPYYALTRKGRLAALSVGAAPGRGMLDEFLAGGEEEGGEEARICRDLAAVSRVSPGLARRLFEGYVRAYCGGGIPDLLPLSEDGLRAASGGAARMAREILEGCGAVPKRDRDRAAAFLGRIAGEEEGAGGEEPGAGEEGEGAEPGAEQEGEGAEPGAEQEGEGAEPGAGEEPAAGRTQH